METDITDNPEHNSFAITVKPSDLESLRQSMELARTCQDHGFQIHQPAWIKRFVGAGSPAFPVHVKRASWAGLVGVIVLSIWLYLIPEQEHLGRLVIGTLLFILLITSVPNLLWTREQQQTAVRRTAERILLAPLRRFTIRREIQRWKENGPVEFIYTFSTDQLTVTWSTPKPNRHGTITVAAHDIHTVYRHGAIYLLYPSATSSRGLAIILVSSPEQHKIVSAFLSRHQITPQSPVSPDEPSQENSTDT